MLLITLTAILTAAVVILFVDGSVDLTNAMFVGDVGRIQLRTVARGLTAESAAVSRLGFLA
jgi:hypothetical protein